jgi:head-tail adaptor
MKSGKLDRLIDIERKAITEDECGQQIEVWARLKTRLASSVSPIRADERFTALQFVARQQVKIWVRYDPALADLNPLDRVVYPAFTPTESPPEAPPFHQIYDIMGVNEIGRQEGIEILAVRRAEQ